MRPNCLFMSRGLHTACKRDEKDHSLDGLGTAVVHVSRTQASCEDNCLFDQRCVGYEYGAQANRCELWYEKIGFSYQEYDFECKVKMRRLRIWGASEPMR